MTAEQYIEAVRNAATHDAACAVKDAAYGAAVKRELTVNEWNSIWLAYDLRTRPWRYVENNWTGD